MGKARFKHDGTITASARYPIDQNNATVNPGHYTNLPVFSRESRIAHLYREKVYHPFIKKLRCMEYGHEPNTAIPDWMQAVSWLDGAGGQLTYITQENNLIREDDMKVTVCKHSAARTGVEQAADVGPIFKVLRSLIKQCDDIHHSYCSIDFQ